MVIFFWLFLIPPQIQIYSSVNGRVPYLSCYIFFCLLFIIFGTQGTAVTKLKIAQKEALGIAEKRSGRRGPGSVVGSSAAACVCALLSISNIGGSVFAALWQLGFVASFCTKLSDTVSSEIGKAYGKTT